MQSNVRMLLEPSNEIFSAIVCDDSRRMHQIMARWCSEVINAEICCIYLLSERSAANMLNGELVFWAGHSDFPGAIFEPTSFSLQDIQGTGVLADAAATKKVYRLRDDNLSNKIRGLARIARLSKFKKCSSALIAPLIDRTGRVAGVLLLANKHVPSTVSGAKAEFSRHDEDTAELLAREIVRLHDVCRVTNVYRAHLQAFSSSGRIEDLYQSILSTGLALLHAERGTLAIEDVERQLLIVQAAHGPGSPNVGDVLSQSNTLFDVWQAEVPYLVVNHHNLKGEPANRNVKSEIAVRWDHGNRRIGVLHAEAFAPLSFDDFDAALLTILFDLATIERESRGKVFHVDRITRDLIERVPERSEILDEVLSVVRDIYGVDAGLIFLVDADAGSLRCSASMGCDGGDFSYGLEEESLAAAVFHDRKGQYIEDPRMNPICNRRGLHKFDIQSPIVAVPLLFRNKSVGVLVVWHRVHRNLLNEKHVSEIEPFARLAAAHIVLSETARQRASALAAYRSIQARMQTEFSLDHNLEMLMQAVADIGFDRVRVFEFRKTVNSFVCRTTLGCQAHLRGYTISPDKNPYAAHTARQKEPVALFYDPRSEEWYGVDPDAGGLGKPDTLCWAAVPLVISGTLCGQLCADNLLTNREITRESLDALTMLGALAAQAIATERTFQVMSAGALWMLHDRFAVEDPSSVVIKRLLVYLTAGSSLGFSRAIFLERNDATGSLAYGYCMGSTDSERHAYVTREADKKGICKLFDEAGETRDPELHEVAKHLNVDLNDSVVRELAECAKQEVCEFLPNQREIWPTWLQSLADRIDAHHLLISLVRTGTRVLGMLIVDRRWQEGQICEADKRALALAASEAAQMLRQHNLHQQILEARDLTALGFIAKGLTHELRQPIGVLRLDTDNFRNAVKRRDWTTAEQATVRVDRNVERLVETVGALESLLRPGERMVRKDIRKLLQNVASLCRQRAVDHEISFVVEVAENIGSLEVIPQLLTQALINLVANAQRAVEETDRADRKILLRAYLANGWFEIEVSDNGHGIPPDILEKLRRRGSVVTTDPRKGLGIGLEIVRRAADAHQGTFQIESELGQGTTMRIRIPAGTCGIVPCDVRS
jgi:signal transduction histidine kinase/GAF domain-containing protein